MPDKIWRGPPFYRRFLLCNIHTIHLLVKCLCVGIGKDMDLADTMLQAVFLHMTKEGPSDTAADTARMNEHMVQPPSRTQPYPAACIPVSKVDQGVEGLRSLILFVHEDPVALDILRVYRKLLTPYIEIPLRIAPVSFGRKRNIRKKVVFAAVSRSYHLITPFCLARSVMPAHILLSLQYKLPGRFCTARRISSSASHISPPLRDTDEDTP